MLRDATDEDREWAASRWDEVGFVRSGPADRVVVAIEDGERVGVGRVVPVAAGVGELGGMYVAASHRGRGVAERIVRHLMEGGDERALFCLPFAHLRPLYVRCGFGDPTGPIPPEVREKYAWCNRTYPDPVLVLQWTRP